MTPATIEQIQTSWAALRPNYHAVVETFYHCLFAREPGLRQMFPADMSLQQKRMGTMLTMTVGWLHRGDTVTPALEELGARHAGYGVEPQHYDAMIFALLDALSVHLGDRFDLCARAAWTEALQVVVATMLGQDGAHGAQAA